MQFKADSSAKIGREEYQINSDFSFRTSELAPYASTYVPSSPWCKTRYSSGGGTAYGLAVPPDPELSHYRDIPR